MWDIKGGFQCFNTPTQGRNALCCVQVQSGWWSSKTTTKAVDEEVHDNALIQGVQKHVLVSPWLSVCEHILCVCVGMCTVSGTSSGLGLDLSSCIPTEWSPEMKRTRRGGGGGVVKKCGKVCKSAGGVERKEASRHWGKPSEKMF